MPSDQPGAQRGREASRPQDIPPAGWKDIAARSLHEVSDNNIFLIAGGVTYSMLLALFPGLAALVSLYGLVLDPNQIEKQVSALSTALPEQTLQLISGELHSLAAASSGTLGFGVAFGVVLALWSASRGMSGLMTALDIAYEQKETRSFLRFNLAALVLTIGAIIGGLIAIALVAALPAAVQFLGLGGLLRWVLLLAQWPLLVVLVIAGLALLYRFGPDREEPQWRWLTPGAIVATVLWIITSLAFTVYVANFDSYNRTYGSLGGAVVMLTWLYISSFVVLLGGVVNAQLERQTRRDTTRGAPRPMGRRGAYAADTVGRSND